MARVSPADPPLAPAAQEELDRQFAAHGRVTNMKRTLAHSPAALRALMEWYPLRDEVAAFLGNRPTTIFAHAVSTEADCLICSTFFRRILIDAGEDPDALRLDAREAALVAYGRALTRDLISVALQESAHPSAGGETFLSKLSELMFVQAIRQYIGILAGRAEIVGLDFAASATPLIQ